MWENLKIVGVIHWFSKTSGIIRVYFYLLLIWGFLNKIIKASIFQILLSTIHSKNYIFHCHTVCGGWEVGTQSGGRSILG